MKRLILLFAALCLTACSDDDGSDAGKQQTLFVASHVTVYTGGGGGGAFEFEYNDEKLLTKLNAHGILYTMTYEKEKITTITSSAGKVEVFSFEYDEEGILKSLQFDDLPPFEVAYDSDENKYTIADLGASFTLNDDNDVIEIKRGVQTKLYAYDTKAKGPMLNVKGNFYLIGFLTNNPYQVSKRPSTEFENYTVQNTFNSDGYLLKAIIIDKESEDEKAATYYNYTAL